MPFDSSPTTDQHPDWHDLLAGYALGNLSPDEQATLQKLLAQRPDLKAEMLAYEEALALVPYALEPQIPPPELELSILSVAQTSRRPQERQRRRSVRPWYQAAMAAAAVVIAVVGVDNYRLRQQRDVLTGQLATAETERQTLANSLVELEKQQLETNLEQVVDILRQPDALVYSLQGTGEALTSSGSLLTLPDHSEVQLVSHNLPVLPQGQVYRLWSVATQTSNPMFCGEFNNTDVGNVQWTIPDARCNARPVKVIITVDAVIDPPVPKGPAVLTGEI
ncbi:MAG: anti-sigma factor [Cyanobacteria bacterium P01_D01_bin.156]